MGQGFRLSNSGVLWDAGFRGLGIGLGSRERLQVPFLLVGYHGEPKVNLFQNMRII